MAEVLLEDVGKTFGRVTALSQLNLRIADHEFVSFLGPSGCGKTTTLNIIAGLETPTTGRILIGDREVTRVPAMDRDIAMVFQSYALYPHMTVAANMGFALRVRGRSTDEIRKAVDRAAAILDIGPLLDRYPRQLSGGQRQRVALGRAMVRDPQVFLLDEPLSNLDAVLRTQTRAELKRLFQDLRTTAIYVTHDQSEAMTMSDRIAVFSTGRIQQVDTPLGIYRAPANRFVASFVGSPPMRFTRMRAGPTSLQGAGLDLPLPPRWPSGQDGRPVDLGLRPEDLVLGDTGEDAVVELVEHLGALRLVHLRLGEASLVAQVAEGEDLRPADRVKVRLSPETFYVFDAESGVALATPGTLRRSLTGGAL